MDFKKTIEKVAHKENMSDEELLEFAKNQWGMIYTYLQENHGAITGAFTITSVAREDLESIGFDTSDVSDDTMKHLASKMADAYCDNGFWIDLPILAEHLDIKKNG